MIPKFQRQQRDVTEKLMLVKRRNTRRRDNYNVKDGENVDWAKKKVLKILYKKLQLYEERQQLVEEIKSFPKIL